MSWELKCDFFIRMQCLCQILRNLHIDICYTLNSPFVNSSQKSIMFIDLIALEVCPI